jgi:hypothetical protein
MLHENIFLHRDNVTWYCHTRPILKFQPSWKSEKSWRKRLGYIFFSNQWLGLSHIWNCNQGELNKTSWPSISAQCMCEGGRGLIYTYICHLKEYLYTEILLPENVFLHILGLSYIWNLSYRIKLKCLLAWN